MKEMTMRKTFAAIMALLTTIGVTQNLYSETPSSGNAQGPSGSYKIKNITRLTDGTSPDLSFDGRLIAYNRKTNNCYEVFLMNADASNQRCITLTNAPQEIVGKHKGKATFHPGGKYLLISSENEHGDHGLKTIPGIGDNHDFWMIDLNTGTFTRITTLPEDTSIQYPRFSNDGSKLMWSQRYEKEKRAIFKKGKEFGYWKIMIADVKDMPTGPKLDNLQAIEQIGRAHV
jgi:Tol biopolymer transport system component